MKHIIFLLTALAILSGCEEKKPEINNRGEITLSSESYGTTSYYRMGFSLEEEQFYQFPVKTTKEIPDIFLVDLPKPPLNDLISFLSTETGSSGRIFKNADFENLTEADNYFNNYILVAEGIFENQSDTIENFQVYTLKTARNNYAKLLIREVRQLGGISSSDYMEVDIKYFIQRDGSLNLSSD